MSFHENIPKYLAFNLMAKMNFIFLPSCLADCVECVNDPVNSVLSSSLELMRCEELHAILHLVLQAGNIMNAVSHTDY